MARKTKKDVSDLISPNYWKTLQAFERIGIDLSKSETSAFKDSISAKVKKRNKIVHHNDDALDLSFDDIIPLIDQFKEYINCLFKAVCADPHIQDQA